MAINIYAVTYISLSELQTVNPCIDEDFIERNPDEFKEILYSLGADCYNYPIEQQDVTHRNRFGNITSGKRWVCNERIDSEWCSSGFASIEARDKALGNKLLVESYKLRGLVEVV